MRGAWLLLVLLVLPLAGAQPLPPASITVRVQPPTDPIQPLLAAVPIPFEVEVTCDASLMVDGMDVRYSITRLPPWATATLSPATDHAGSDLCQSGRVLFHGTALVGTSDAAPAFAPDAMEITATAFTSTHASNPGRASFPVTAGYFSIVEAQPMTSSVAVGPNEMAVVPVKLTNLGNGNTKVVFDVVTDASDLAVELPAPVILQSRQSGGTVTAADLAIPVHRSDHVNAQTETFTLRWRASYALDGRITGDSGSLTFSVTPGDGKDPASLPPGLRTVPTPTFLLVAAAVLAVALVKRRPAP